MQLHKVNLLILLFIIISFTPSNLIAGILRLFFNGSAKEVAIGGYSLLRKDIYHPTLLLNNNQSITFQYTYEDTIRSEGEKAANSSTKTLSIITTVLYQNGIILLKVDKSDSYLNSKAPHSNFTSSAAVNSTAVAYKINKYITIGYTKNLTEHNADGFSLTLPEQMKIFEGIPTIVEENNQKGEVFGLGFNTNKTNVTFYYNEPKVKLSLMMFDNKKELRLPLELNKGEYKEWIVTHQLNNNLKLISTKINNHLKGENDIEYYDKPIDNIIQLGKSNQKIDYKSKGIGVIYNPVNTITLFSNYTEEELDAYSEGNFSLSQFESFIGVVIAPLSTPRAFYLGKLKLNSKIYHIGVEKELTKKITIRAGLKYNYIKPDAHIITIIKTFLGTKIEKEEKIYLQYDKINVYSLSTGFTYNITDNIELNYSAAQLIPVLVKRKIEKTPKIEETPKQVTKGKTRGGQLHIIELTYYF